MTGSEFRLRVGAEAARNLDRLSPKIGVAVVEFITATLLENPSRLSKPMRGEFRGLRSARRGDYRVLLRIHAGARIVEVVRIAHRADVYRS